MHIHVPNMIDLPGTDDNYFAETGACSWMIYDIYDSLCGVITYPCPNLYYSYEKSSLSPLKRRSLALIEQHLPNISDLVYSVHQSFMWFLWLNWRKSTFYPVTAPNGSKCWPIVTSSIQELIASNCDITMTVVAMDAFLAQWWGQWSQHSGRPRTFLALISLLK